MTLSIGFDLTQCAYAHDRSNRLIIRLPKDLVNRREQKVVFKK